MQAQDNASIGSDRAVSTSESAVSKSRKRPAKKARSRQNSHSRKRKVDLVEAQLDSKEAEEVMWMEMSFQV